MRAKLFSAPWFARTVFARTVVALAIGSSLIPAVTPLAAQNMGLPGASEDPTDDSDEKQVAQPVPVHAEADDADIQSRLAEILAATEWFKHIDVQVRDSVVFLGGVAENSDRKTWASELARNTQGVAAVVNRMEVDRDINLPATASKVSESLQSMWEEFLWNSPLIIAGLVVIVLTALASRVSRAVVGRLARRSRLRISLQDLFLQLLTIGVWIVGLLIAAVVMFPEMTPSRALAVLGLGSIAIGFAFKDIFENFFAGVMILWKYPFDRGDFIECGDVMGRIEDITVRMTMIRQVDGQLVIVPNAMLFNNSVDVLTSRPSRRQTVTCGVAYRTNLNEAQRVLKQAVEGCSTVRQAEPVEIFAQEFADSSINFEVTWWTGPTPLDIRRSRDEVVRAIKHALDEAGIEIPFPQRTLWLPQPVRANLLTADEDQQ